MRTNRSEYNAHAALKAGANQPVRVVKPRQPVSAPIRWGMCAVVGFTIGAALVIGLGALL